MEKQIVIRFPIMGKGNPLKRAAQLGTRVKNELGVEPTLSNAGPGSFDEPAEPYSVTCAGKTVWSGKSLDVDEVFEAVQAFFASSS